MLLGGTHVRAGSGPPMLLADLQSCPPRAAVRAGRAGVRGRVCCAPLRAVCDAFRGLALGTATMGSGKWLA